MGIKFGEIDSGQILQNEYKIDVLENVLQFILNKNAGSIISPSKDELSQIRKSVVDSLKKKYPNSGIDLKEE